MFSTPVDIENAGNRLFNDYSATKLRTPHISNSKRLLINYSTCNDKYFQISSMGHLKISVTKFSVI